MVAWLALEDADLIDADCKVLILNRLTTVSTLTTSLLHLVILASSVSFYEHAEASAEEGQRALVFIQCTHRSGDQHDDSKLGLVVDVRPP